MTKTITITDIADLRAGDIATCSYDGHEFTGEAWPSSTYGPLFVGASFVRYADGSPNPAVPLISATRALPDLPIELGSVIANVVTRDGCHYDWAMPVTGPANSLGPSWVVSSADRYDWVHPDQIVSWTPCTVEVQP